MESLSKVKNREPIEKKPRRLGLEPAIDPSARVHQSKLGVYTAVGPRTTMGETEFGDYSYVVNDSSIMYAEIGKFCSIAAHTRINPGNHPTVVNPMVSRLRTITTSSNGGESTRSFLATTSGLDTVRSSCPG